MIQVSDGLRVMSRPLIQGLTTSWFLRPFGLGGSSSHFRAVAPSTSNAPTFTGPWKERLRMWGRRRTAGKFRLPVVRSEWMAVAGLPSSRFGRFASFAAKHTRDTRTAAPIHRPRLVIPRIVDHRGGRDPVQHRAARALADRLRGDEADARAA